MKNLQALLLTITAALCMPIAVNATPQCVPLKPEVQDQACMMVDERRMFSPHQVADLLDGLPPLDTSVPWLDKKSPWFSFDFDIEDNFQLSPFESEVLHKPKQEKPATSVDEMSKDQS